MGTLSGGVFGSADDDFAELRQLADSIGMESFDAGVGRLSLPDSFDGHAWTRLEDAGLTRLNSDAESGGGAIEAAVVLRSMARYAVTVPVAETDLLACWLAEAAGLDVPPSGPLTVAFGNSGRCFTSVPYAATATAIVFAIPDCDRLRIAVRSPSEVSITKGHNAGGEPRDTVTLNAPDDEFVVACSTTELTRRGAWARCAQVMGALDAAVESSREHTADRIQFGRPLNAFQTVQHALALMAGQTERARAAAELAVAAVAEDGFDSSRSDYAVTLAKVTLGHVVPSVITAAHQLHGAIGVTLEHHLRLATQRARSWIGEFGDTSHYARKLGRMAMSGDPWTFVVDGTIGT